MPALLSEHETWFDEITGQPLNAGYVYIGARNLSPKDNLITIYSDRDLTTPIANPQRTDSSGKTENKIYVAEPYSIEVEDVNNVQKYINLNNGDIGQGSAVASAATADIWASGESVHITGAVGITSFGTAPVAGASKWVIFDSTPTLTHSANLNLQGGVDITAVAGDMAFVYADTTTQMDVVYYRMDRSDNNINERIKSRASPTDKFIETSEAVEDTLSITIPATWNTYDVDVTVSCFIEETGTGTGNRGYTLRVRNGTTVSGTEMASVQGLIGNASPDNRAPAGFYGFQEGLTATGAQSWVFTSIITGDGGEYSIKDISWSIEATRTG